MGLRAAPSCAAASAAVSGAEQRRRPRLCPPPLALLLLLLLSLGLLHAGTGRVREGASPGAQGFVPKHPGFRRRWPGRKGGVARRERPLEPLTRTFAGLAARRLEHTQCAREASSLPPCLPPALHA